MLQDTLFKVDATILSIAKFDYFGRVVSEDMIFAKVRMTDDKWLFGPGELEKEGYFYMPFKNE